MSQRDFHLAAYDVTEARRLKAVLDLTRAFATGGQKSVHEIWLTPAEKAELLQTMTLILDDDEDRFLLLRLDPRARVHTLGKALPPADPRFIYLG